MNRVAVKTNMRREAEVILEQDASVQQDKDGQTGFHEYFEGGFDESKLTNLVGSPSRLRLQGLVYDQRQAYKDMGSPATRQEFLMRCGLLGAKGFERQHENGTVTDLPACTFEDSQYGRPLLKREWLTDANLPTPIIIEVCSMIIALSEGSVPFIGKSAPPSTPGGTEGSKMSPGESSA